MRHNKAINSLGRKSAHRKAMLSNMASSLIMHKRIKTTVAKAKALRIFIEPILTKSKDDTTHSRRLAFSYLNDKDAVTTLFREVSPKIMERPGGYTRILKIGTRLGDAAEMCYIELVDFNEAMLAASGAAETKSTRRGRRGSSRKKADGEVKAQKPVEEEVVTSAEEDKAEAVPVSETEAATGTSVSEEKETSGQTDVTAETDTAESPEVISAESENAEIKNEADEKTEEPEDKPEEGSSEPGKKD